MRRSMTVSLYDLIQRETHNGIDRVARIIGYLPGCYPDRTTYRTALGLIRRSGIRVVEIGIPGAIGSLEGGVISDALKSVQESSPSLRDVVVNASNDVRQNGLVPIVMAFRATVFDEIGYKTFVDSVVEGGASLMLVPDVKPDEAERLSVYAATCDVRMIPFSSAIDEAFVFGNEAPFVYLQTANMPTGGDFLPSRDLQRRIHQQSLRNPGVPVGVGFGIRTSEDVARVYTLGADFAIVGTAMVEALSRGIDTFSQYLERLTEEEAGS